MVWFGEEVVGAKSSRDISVAVELASVVKGDGFQDASERLQSTDDGGTDLVSFERRHQRGPKEARRAIYHGDDAAGAASADNRVDFNVTDPLTEVHFGRASKGKRLSGGVFYKKVCDLKNIRIFAAGNHTL